jgi:hypothetical protein
MEVPANGVQREPATALLDSLPAFETGEELTYPKIRDVTDMACSVITRIMGMGSDKSTFGQWFHTDSIRYRQGESDGVPHRGYCHVLPAQIRS